MADRAERQLTMTIRDKALPLSKVLEAQKYLVNILKEIDRKTASTHKTKVEWIVTSAKAGSYSVTVEGISKDGKTSEREIIKKIKKLESGLRDITTTGIRPTYFSDALLTNAQKLANLSTSEDSVSLLNSFGQINLDKKLARNIEKIIGGRHKSYGAVEGILNVIDLRDKPIFKLSDRLTLETIDCYFDRQILGQATQALERRVYVYGLIYSREDGKRVKVEVEEIKIFPIENELPDVDQIVGLWRSLDA
ncbi:hypothetical protein Pse7367_1272 [Thalassoporum mexicanum PCC 7367]|uniref:hypothetical protein n=1 Tax=Thalassoporum mexicanum TaxID=3457544 RepID=UPI00029FEE17|nr:hypothetical protein [Pseudanabaena sp. PCC 7367]AFY69566.1 hypothetical protein Pse7367_1272 [Pseudanabaena sp. PCC 7367]